MSSYSQIKIAYKALRQLGIKQVGLNAIYRFGLRSGHYSRTLNAALARLNKVGYDRKLELQPCLRELPDRQSLLNLLASTVDLLFTEAEEIIQGKVRLFGGQPIPLVLAPPGKMSDWSNFESGDELIAGQDIKFIWEPARLGWACKLAMAYHLSREERYAGAFWEHVERFITDNPPYKGPNWSSAQEAAIRIIVLAFTMQVFASSMHSTPVRIAMIARTIAIHAERIPPTMVYARSFNNNHLISEALGLLTASVTLPGHPYASSWKRLGKKWLNQAFHTQISPDGTYTQHSTNYHRFMLQCALWASAMHRQDEKRPLLSPDVLARLGSATSWLAALVDPDTGCVPNLGHNDGSYILPLSVCPHSDFRPVLDAASREFCKTKLKPDGPWDDMSYWLGLSGGRPGIQTGIEERKERQKEDQNAQSPFVLANPKNHSWALFNVVHFSSRPAHADQLGVDLWWKGLNLAQDAGTYLYNPPPPWDNSLSSAFVHNTITLDQHEFMQRAGRFLYLDWAQGKLLDRIASDSGSWIEMTAQHDGYRGSGIIHTRTVSACADGRWQIVDVVSGAANQIHTARLHWLLPDREYEIRGPYQEEDHNSYEIAIKSPHGLILLKMGVKTKSGHTTGLIQLQIARAGILVAGTGSVPPIAGWTSPTYGDKMPALACILEIKQELPINLKSEWILPTES